MATQDSNMADEAPTSKACTKCGVVKLFEMFVKKKECVNGVTGLCKQCSNEIARSRRARNPEKEREYRAKWNEKNPERRKQYSKNYRENNPENRRLSQNKYATKNYEKIKIKNNKHRLANPEKYRAAAKRFATKHPEKVKLKLDRWKSMNKDAIREYSAKRVAELTDSYVAVTLRTPLSQATPEEIEYKRLEITLKRGLKAFKQAQTQKGTKP